MFVELDSSLFDWLTWRANNLWSAFKIQCHTNALVQNREVLQRYVVGWCRGEHLTCRPKSDNVAVMFCKDGVYFWTHFRKEEAWLIWGIR
jgi:hypothetical protein